MRKSSNKATIAVREALEYDPKLWLMLEKYIKSTGSTQGFSALSYDDFIQRGGLACKYCPGGCGFFNDPSIDREYLNSMIQVHAGHMLMEVHETAC